MRPAASLRNAQKSALAWVLALVATMSPLAMRVADATERLVKALRRSAFARSAFGNVAISGITAAIYTVVGGLLVIIVIMALLAGFAPTYFGNVKNFTLALINVDTGSPVADTIVSTLGIVVPIVAALTLVGYAFAALARHGSGE